MKEAYVPVPVQATPEAPVVTRAPLVAGLEAKEVVFAAQIDLTPETAPRYAEDNPQLSQGGDIFMPEAAVHSESDTTSSEYSRTTRENGKAKPVTAEAQQKAREAWKKELAKDGKSLDKLKPEERKRYEDLAKQGKTPEQIRAEAQARKAAANLRRDTVVLYQLPPEEAVRVNADTITSPRLKDIAQQVRATIQNGAADEAFFTRLLQRVEGLVDQGIIAPAEGRVFIHDTLEPMRHEVSVSRGTQEKRTEKVALKQEKSDTRSSFSAEALGVAKEFLTLEPIATELKNLYAAAQSGNLTAEQFEKKAEPLQQRLWNLEQTYYRPPDDMSPEQQAEVYRRFDAARQALSEQLANIYIEHYAQTELHQEAGEASGKLALHQNLGEGQQEAQEAENIATEIHEAYAELDRLLERPNEQRDADWQRDCDAEYTRIENAIIRLDLSDGNASRTGIFEVIVRESLSDGTGGIRDRREKEHYGFALEFAVEQIIGQGDFNATADYPQPSFYAGINLDDMIQRARKVNEGFYIYLTNLRGKRQLSHDLFKNLKDRQTLVGIVAKALDPGAMRFIEEQIAGVMDAQALYEKELGKVAGSNTIEERGWILSEQYRDDIDVHVEQMMYQMHLQRHARSWSQDERNKMWRPNTHWDKARRMREWESRRAFNMGRALTGAMLRRQIYAFYNDAPDNIPNLVKSLEGGEQIDMIMAPIARVAARYFGHKGAELYMQLWVERMKEEAQRREVNSGGLHYAVERTKIVNGQEVKQRYGLYGASEKATVMLDTGVVDIKSSWWRADFMLQQDEFGIRVEDANGNPHRMSIDAFLTEKKTQYKKHLQRTSEEYRNAQNHVKLHMVDHAMNHDHEVQDVLANQRLFLGILARRKDLTPETKEMIWKNASKLIPSRIAALMPQFSMDEVAEVYGLGDWSAQGNEAAKEVAKGHWDTILNKLFVVEHQRMQNDGSGVRLNEQGERNRQDYVPNDLWHFINQQGENFLTPQEREVVRRWMQLGEDMSGQLSRIIWPHTPFLDDVPLSGFKEWGRNEFDRLLINDHQDWDEAYQGIVKLISNPATDHPEKADEEVQTILKHFVEKAKNPESLEDAFRRVEAHVWTWSKMAEKYKAAKFLYDAETWIRKPTSMMEEFNLTSNISYDEGQMAKFLSRLAMTEVISDDPSETDEKGQTQFWRLTKELHADRWAKFLMQIRFLLLVFPIEFIEAIIGVAIPDDMKKG